MLISSAFPSNFLRAVDLQGRAVRVTIDTVKLEEIGGETRPILYFEGKQRGLPLNKTNATTIAAMLGDETLHWEGQQIELYPTETDFQGKRVQAIRVRMPAGAGRANVAAPLPTAYAEQSQSARPAQRQAAMAGGDDLNDEVPF